MALRTTPGGVYSAGGAGGFGGGYATDVDVMGQGKTLVLNKKDEMVAEVNKCMSILDGMVWDGPARVAHDQLQLRVKDWHGKSVQLWDTFGGSIGTSQQQYLQNESDNQSLLKSAGG